MDKTLGRDTPLQSQHAVKDSNRQGLTDTTLTEQQMTSPGRGEEKEDDEWTCFRGGGEEEEGAGAGGVGGGEGRAAEAGHSAQAKDHAADPVVGGEGGGEDQILLREGEGAREGEGGSERIGVSEMESHQLVTIALETEGIKD